MDVRFTPRAESEVQAKQSWWRKNREKAPDLFDEELLDAVTKIRDLPSIGAIFASGFPATVRRLLMPKTRNNLFYAVVDGDILVLSVWGHLAVAVRSFRQARSAGPTNPGLLAVRDLF